MWSLHYNFVLQHSPSSKKVRTTLHFTENSLSGSISNCISTITLQSGCNGTNAPLPSTVPNSQTVQALVNQGQCLLIYDRKPKILMFCHIFKTHPLRRLTPHPD